MDDNWITAATKRAREIERLERIDTLYDAIAHGDEAHRAWLKQAITDHFAGRPVDRHKETT